MPSREPEPRPCLASSCRSTSHRRSARPTCGSLSRPQPPAPPVPSVGEQLGDLDHELLLPGRHLARVDAELARQLSRRPVTLDGRKSHLRLECRPEYTSLPSHRPALIGCLPPTELHLFKAPDNRGPPRARPTCSAPQQRDAGLPKGWPSHPRWTAQRPRRSFAACESRGRTHQHPAEDEAGADTVRADHSVTPCGRPREHAAGRSWDGCCNQVRCLTRKAASDRTATRLGGVVRFLSGPSAQPIS